MMGVWLRASPQGNDGILYSFCIIPLISNSQASWTENELQMTYIS